MPNVSSVITVRTASSHTPIAGAQVFVNGIGKGSTDGAGHVTLSLPDGSTYDLAVKATSYTTFTTSGVLANQSFTVNMEAVAPVGLIDFKLTIWPEEPARGVPLVFSNAGNPISANYNVGGVTIFGLTAGPQTVTASIPGYLAVNEIFDVSQQASGTIELRASTDTGGALKQQNFGSQDPETASLLPALTPEDVPEFVAPNFGQGTYFTMTQARMYIGDLFIDELNGLQFALQDNKIPIYGYASRYYDAMAQGKSLVQGQFMINFISEGYLVSALRRYRDQLGINAGVPVDEVRTQQQARLTSLVNKLQNPDPAWTPAMFAAAKSEINSLAASLGSASLVAATNGISLARKKQDNNIIGLAGGDYPNAVYEDVAFDVIVEYTGAGRTITRRLEDCHLISNESIMDHSGTPILDSYGFVARRLR